MDRKYSKSKAHHPPRLKRANIRVLCVAVAIISISGVASFRMLASNPLLDTDNLEKRDPSEPFRLGPVITNWDEQRVAWLEKNPHMRLNLKGKQRMFMLTGSQTDECSANPAGDFWLLKAYKNKMDYCRLHDIQSYYSTSVMNNAMVDFWVKLPLFRNIMLTHPEVEWILWIDSDAFITDMVFEIPLEKYKDHNMVIHGWPTEVFDNKNWVGLNAGIFLMRNCQWSLDFLDLWGSMGENRGDHRINVGKVLSQSLKGRQAENFPSDDQSSLIYTLNDQRETLAPKVYLENDYYLHGYWVILTEKYEEMMSNSRPGYGDDRWPFVTHFVGCKLCAHNNDYSQSKCIKHMSRAFNFADNQVIKEWGFQHVSLESPILRRVRNESSILAEVM